MSRDEIIAELASLAVSNLSEVVALVDDLGLEPRVPRWFELYQARQDLFRFHHRPSLPCSALEKPRTLCERLFERNHHRKDFSNVYSPDYHYQDLSLWD